MSIKTEKKNIDIFLETLRKRLHEKADEGYTWWDYDHDGLGDDNGRLPSTASTPDLRARLEYALDEEKYIDVVAFASMLWRRQTVDASAAANLKVKGWIIMITCNCNQCASAGNCEIESDRRENSLFAWTRGETLAECLLFSEQQDRGGR